METVLLLLIVITLLQLYIVKSSIFKKHLDHDDEHGRRRHFHHEEDEQTDVIRHEHEKPYMPDYEILKGAESGNCTRISLALKKGAALHAKNNQGVSALIIAANNGHHEAVKVLIDAGAHIDDYSNNGRTPLIWAAWWGHLKVVEVLLNHNAHVNEQDNHGMTPLMSATVNGHIGVVELLLKHGKSKVGMKNEWNSTALSIAKRKQYHHIIELLEPLHPYERHISPYELLFHHSYSGIINVIKDVLSLLGIPTEFLDTLTSVKTGEAEDGL